MANYTCSARSNTFKIGQPQAFLEWLEEFSEIHFEETSTDPEACTMSGTLFCENTDGGGWPSCIWDEDKQTYRDIFFAEELGQFLTPDSIAVLYEVGSEKLRYLVGYAVAVNYKGETIQLSLHDIFPKIQEEWGIESVDTGGI